MCAARIQNNRVILTAMMLKGQSRMVRKIGKWRRVLRMYRARLVVYITSDVRWTDVTNAILRSGSARLCKRGSSNYQRCRGIPKPGKYIT